MMKPGDLAKSIYLGDRGVVSICLDGSRGVVIVTVDSVSRIRAESGLWDHSTEEDIENAGLVFTGVDLVSFTPSGPLPNDTIEDFTVEDAGGDGSGDERWWFRMSIGSVGQAGNYTSVLLTIRAIDFFLQDPRSPGRMIRD